MLVLPDAPIHRAVDLAGKLAATNGLASEMPSALASGRVDAVYIAEPFATAAKQHARILFYRTVVTKDGDVLGAGSRTATGRERTPSSSAVSTA
jgi:hypothetical protein